jgi:hypothetical protein
LVLRSIGWFIRDRKVVGVFVRFSCAASDALKMGNIEAV